MKDNAIFCIIFILLFGSSQYCGASRPNIIFIVADDLGWNDVSFHGSKQIPTPNIDVLAYDGIIFNNYYVSYLCTPSRGALMTGKHPVRIGLQHSVIIADEPWGLPLEERTLPQYLKESGYSTHGIGKWHLGFFEKEYIPTRRGFDTFFGSWTDYEDYYSYVHTMEPGISGYDFHDNEEIARNYTGKFLTKLYTSKAKEIIQNHDYNKPLFLYLAHQAVHTGNEDDPLQAPSQYVNHLSYIKDKQRRKFAGMVTALDDAIGELFRTLDEMKILNNTIIVFTTDNGGSVEGYSGGSGSNFPLRGSKETLWEGGVRGIAWLWSSQLRKKSRVFDGMMHISDWLPTLLAASGDDTTEFIDIDGINQWPSILNAKPSPRKEILHNIDPILKTEAVRKNRFKLIQGEINNPQDSPFNGWFDREGKNITESNVMAKDANGNVVSNTILQGDLLRTYCPISRILLKNFGISAMQKLSAPKDPKLAIHCGPIPKSAFRNCLSKNACLFDIENDPCEFYNVASKFPLGWNDVSYNGSPQIPTPNIDALAASGVILQNCYATPMCTPSRGAFMTGKYPIHTGLQHHVINAAAPYGLPLKDKILPQFLKELGYETHGIGKWHLGYYKKEYTPTYRGFDSFFGYWNGVIDYYDFTNYEAVKNVPGITGWNDVSYNGSPQIPTPNIDALAASGVILQNCYATPMCTPSRGAFMTGKYPIHTGLQHHVINAAAPYGLPLKEKILPQFLKELGYETHGIGKWHLGYYKKEYTPTYRGFDSFFGYWNGVLDYYDFTNYEAVKNVPGITEVWGMDLHDGINVAKGYQGQYATDLFTEKTLKVIDQHNTSKPLFLYVSHLAPHVGNPHQPMQAPPEYVAKFDYIKDMKRRIHAGVMSKLDESVGKIFLGLHNRGMLDNSIIVFASDNGGAPEGFRGGHGSNWPLRGAKMGYFEGGIKVPALLWSPLFHLKEPRISKELMHISDWLPTLYAAAGGNVKNIGVIDGTSMWDHIIHKTPSPRKEILININSILGQSALIHENFKLILGVDPQGQNTWYGPSGHEDLHVPSMDSWVWKTGSVVKDVLQNTGRWLLKEADSWRTDTEIHCSLCQDHFVKKNPSMRGPQLFDLKKDPCEYNNLASNLPKVLATMLERLEVYNSTSVKPLFTSVDPHGDPMCHNFAYVSWLDNEHKSTCPYFKS